MCFPKLHYSYRRELIDKELSQIAPQISGHVLDLGGKKTRKRGEFRPPEEQTASWVYLNLNPGEKPDLVGNGEKLPVKDGAFDWVICTEVMEYVENPSIFVSEISRALKKGGKMILTAPFLYRIHGKPHDLQRFTEDKLRKLVSKDFKIIKLNPQGYFFTVLADFEKAWVAQMKFAPARYLLGILLIPSLICLRFYDRFAKSDFLTSFTTGYFMLAEKK